MSNHQENPSDLPVPKEIGLSNPNKTNEKFKRSSPGSGPKISYSGKRKRNFRLLRFAKLLPLLLIPYCLLLSYIENRMAPQIRELAEAQAEKHLLETVNREVMKIAEREDVRYDNMVKTIRDSKGEVIYLEVDTAQLAGAKAKLVGAIDKSLEKNKRITVSVPLGSISKWSILSGVGFPIRIKVHPIGMTEGDIYTVLEDCGINQTRHLIQIKIHATLVIVLPGENAQVETAVTLPLGERVLVGEVPEIYLDSIGAGS